MTLHPRPLGALRLALTALAVGLISLGLASEPASARGLTVDIWTDRGQDGVYRPGDRIEISASLTEGAYMLVYEIDAEGYVHVLFPYERTDAYLEGPTTLRLPNDETDLQLVTEAPAGEGYIVAIASVDPFEDMPWYLRPYDANLEELGTVNDRGEGSESDGVTAEGRIVGDPFVAMERIRRAVLQDDQDRASFATSYTTYYVHERVKYPRYVCYDCHRPGEWRWWDGFDPYYTSCSTFELRVNVGWWWGPSYWFGHVPYYVYAYRPDCPPGYRHYGGAHYSSWNGWNTWCNLWGPLRRYKTAPPAGYLPPVKYDVARRWRETGRDTPPGFMAAAHQVRERRAVMGRGAKDWDPGASNGSREAREGRQRRGGLEPTPRAADPNGTPRERRGNGDAGSRERRGSSDVVPRERRGNGSGDTAPRDRRDSGSRPSRPSDEVPVRRERPGARQYMPDPSGDRTSRWNAGTQPRIDRPAPVFRRSEPRLDQPVTPRYDAPPPRVERPREAPQAPRQESPRFEAPRATPPPAPAPSPPSGGRTSWGGGQKQKG